MVKTIEEGIEPLRLYAALLKRLISVPFFTVGFLILNGDGFDEFGL